MHIVLVFLQALHIARWGVLAHVHCPCPACLPWSVVIAAVDAGPAHLQCCRPHDLRTETNVLHADAVLVKVG